MSKFFLPYQERFIKDPSRFIIYEKSRRIGISLACAYKIFIERITKKIDCIICSADFKTSKSFLRDIEKFAKASNIILKHDYIDESSITSETIVMPNGSRIIAVSNSPTAFRGLGGTVVLDEFAFSQYQEQLFTAAAPLADWHNGKIFIISTHNGIGTVFNDLLKKARDGKIDYKVYRTTLQDAIDEGLSEKIQGSHSKLPTKEERAAAYLQFKRDNCLNNDMFKQEYMCDVLGAATLINEETYTKNISNIPVLRDTLTEEYLSKSGPLFIGIDPARNGDNTAIWIISQGTDPTQKNPKLSTVYRTILVRLINNMPFQAQYEVMASLINHQKVRKVIIESNGIGAGLSEQLAAHFPSKVIPQHTNAINKAVNIERLVGWMNQGRITMPPDADIKSDIMSMKRILTSSGKLSYDGRTTDGHCDAFLAASFSLQAAEGEAQEFLNTLAY